MAASKGAESKLCAVLDNSVKNDLCIEQFHEPIMECEFFVYLNF